MQRQNHVSVSRYLIHLQNINHTTLICLIRVGTICTVYAFSCTVQSGLRGVESVQHVLFMQYAFSPTIQSGLPSLQSVQHVLFMHSVLLSSLDYPVYSQVLFSLDYPVYSRSSTFNATNVAWQDVKRLLRTLKHSIPFSE